jgi:hypothetical protein
MRILAFITAAEPIDAILNHLRLPVAPPLLSPARGPPQPELAFDTDPGFELDQTPACDLTEPEPDPDSSPGSLSPPPHHVHLSAVLGIGV